MNEKALAEQIAESILDFDGNRVAELVEIALNQNVDLTVVLNDGLTAGLQRLGERFENGQAFLPELMWAAEIVQRSIKVLEPHVKEDVIRTKGKLLIASVEGDIHDVGKNIVGSVFSGAGYQVVDLGIDIPTEILVQKVIEEKPELLGLSALLTTTMLNQREVIEALEEAGLRQNVKIIIGGAPASASWAEEIGADAYAEDAFAGLKSAGRLLG